MNAEISVQGENDGVFVQFGEADEAGVGQGHGVAAVAAHQRVQIGRLIFDCYSLMSFSPFQVGSKHHRRFTWT